MPALIKVRSLVVKSTLFVLPALGLALAVSAGAQGAGKVGVINIQSAIVSTKDGQKAATEIQTRFNPKKVELDKRQGEIGQLQDQLNRGRNTLSEDARNKLVRDIDQKTKSLNRETEDARAELDQEEQKIMNELGGRIMAVIDKYAKDNSYSLILDVSSPQTPVLYASNTIDITKDIIDLYDKNAPAATSGTGTPSGTSVARPAITRPAPAAPKPAPTAPPK
ncbi:MAG: outer rane chaperone Skp (OmpH) [Bryobacterales bacterium]|nr:outer rane chaperone Skp (OmpH) [Bryobacterales bacterium]